VERAPRPLLSLLNFRPVQSKKIFAKSLKSPGSISCGGLIFLIRPKYCIERICAQNIAAQSLKRRWLMKVQIIVWDPSWNKSRGKRKVGCHKGLVNFFFELSARNTKA
jgi:hypothetical protein